MGGDCPHAPEWNHADHHGFGGGEMYSVEAGWQRVGRRVRDMRAMGPSGTSREIATQDKYQVLSSVDQWDNGLDQVTERYDG